MPVDRYSWKLRRVVPMLDADEFAPIDEALRHRIQSIKDYRQEHNCGLVEALSYASSEALDLYENLTGLRLEHPDQLEWVSMAKYGPDCTSCGKPLRTDAASFCAECGTPVPTSAA